MVYNNVFLNTFLKQTSLILSGFSPPPFPTPALMISVSWASRMSGLGPVSRFIHVHRSDTVSKEQRSIKSSVDTCTWEESMELAGANFLWFWFYTDLWKLNVW